MPDTYMENQNPFDPVTGEIPSIPDHFDSDTTPEKIVETIVQQLNTLAVHKPLHFPAGLLAKSLADTAHFWSERLNDDYEKLGHKELMIMAEMNSEIVETKMTEIQNQKAEKEEQIAFFETLLQRSGDAFENITGNRIMQKPRVNAMKNESKSDLTIKLRRVEETLVYAANKGQNVPEQLINTAKTLRSLLNFNPDKPVAFSEKGLPITPE